MVLDQGTTFVFGSWFYVANGSGGFNSHLTNPREPEAISVKSSNIANRSSDLGEMLLPDLAMKSRRNSPSSRVLLGLKSNSGWNLLGLRFTASNPFFGYIAHLLFTGS